MEIKKCKCISNSSWASITSSLINRIKKYDYIEGEVYEYSINESPYGKVYSVKIGNTEFHFEENKFFDCFKII